MARGRFTFPFVASLPKRGNENFLYAFETSDGAVKVGRSYTPRQRFTQHLYDLKRRGTRMLRFAVIPSAGDVYLAELELMQRLGRIGSACVGTNEWFRGVPWGTAHNLLRQIATRQFVVLGSSRRRAPPASEKAGA